MNLRVKELRKSLRLSRDDFGKQLGVSRDVIANIELDRLAKPEQKEPLLKLICKTFHVNYEWLTTGQGDMYVQTIDTFVDNLCSRFEVSYYARKLIESYLALGKEQKDVLEVFLDGLIKACNADTPAEKAIDEAISKITSARTVEDEADEFADMAREQFLIEKRAGALVSSAKESGAV